VAEEVGAAVCDAQPHAVLVLPPDGSGPPPCCRYERERARAERLQAELSQRGPASPPAGLGLPHRSSGVQRRHTLPLDALLAAEAMAWAQAGAAAGASSPCGEPSDAGGPAGEGVSLSRLGTALATCVLQRAFSRGGGAPVGGGASRQDTDGGEHATVSVADDGTTGVGATAAAAVSVALAQSWAAVAGGKSSCFPRPGCLPAHPAKARFKLVAAVPRSHNRRRRAASPEAPGAAPSPLRDLPDAGANGSNLALESLEDARVLDDTQEASWRSSGSHLKLHWLSPPSTVLVVHKPSEEVVATTAQAVAWLLRRGITVFTEPGAHAGVAAAARQVLAGRVAAGAPAGEAGGGGRLANAGSADSTTAVSATPPPDNFPPTPELEAAAPAGGGRGDAAGGAASPWPSLDDADADADDARCDADEALGRLLSWGAEACACADTIPAAIADRIDLVLTLGGDGTVLWACSLFAAGAVPPVVPLAMGSLGFMTPFPTSRMPSVLARVTSVAHGFPLMLRHRLQARIVRAGGSGADLAGAAGAGPGAAGSGGPCGEDAVVLNEVVIDRGMTASLANLQCYVDHNLVTAIQGDGLIVATPTGSTAYNLAAGGCMVHPSVPCVLFTPICPHTLASRPLVFPEHVTLRVKVPADSRGEAYCSFDGRGRRTLFPGDSVVIHLSQWPVPMVCNLDASHDWFLSVKEGLNWNRRQAQKPIAK
jgi:NAD+ kinase